jgi:hypothetical protein
MSVCVERPRPSKMPAGAVRNPALGRRECVQEAERNPR